MGGIGGGGVVHGGTRVGSLGPPHLNVGGGEDGSDVDAGESRKNVKARLSCQLCGRLFGQMEDLRRHIRTHTGEKPYVCPFCPYRAAVKSSVVRHARTIHSATAAPTTQTTMGV